MGVGIGIRGGAKSVVELIRLIRTAPLAFISMRFVMFRVIRGSCFLFQSRDDPRITRNITNRSMLNY